MQRESQAAVSTLVSSAPQDQPLADALKEQLRPLEEDEHISLWEGGESNAPTTGEHAVNEQLNPAQLMLLLVSPDF